MPVFDPTALGDKVTQGKAKKLKKEASAKVVPVDGSGRTHPQEEEGLEATEEEQLEELQDAKVRYIQKAFRSRRARRLVRELVVSNFTKEYDRETGEFVYRNKRTGERQSRKPAALGSADLPDPEVFLAPVGFEASRSEVRQFALVVHCTDFADSKLPNLPQCLSQDHAALRAALVNPYLAKYEVSDCVFALNPTRDAFLGHVETLQSLVDRFRRDDDDVSEALEEAATAVLLVYISTHVARVTKGRHRGTYVCLSDTNASNAGLLRRTSVPVKELCSGLAKIRCAHKTVFLDVAHAPKPRDTLLKVLIVYPPPNLYAVVAHGADCRVIGSCKLGPSTETAPRVFGQPAEEDTAQDDAAAREEEDVAENVETAACAESAARHEQTQEQTKEHREATDPETGLEEQEEERESGPDRAAEIERAVFENEAPSRSAVALDQSDDPHQAPSGAGSFPATVRARRVWVPRVPRIPRRAPAVPGVPWPRLRLLEVEETNGEKYVVQDELDVIRGWPRQGREGLKSGVRSARRRLRERAEERRARRVEAQTKRLAEYEVALYEERGSFFGSAVADALSGHAARLPERRISVGMIFDHVALALDLAAHRLLERAAKETSKFERTGGRFGQRARDPQRNTKGAPRPVPKLVIQTPQACAGRGVTEQYTTAAATPDPPPAPDPPRALRVHDRTALLAWADPTFSGAPPIEYQVQSRGTAKLDKTEWACVAAFATISSPRFQAPHLVPGMGVRFRVRARNHGGWGDWSEASDLVVPLKKHVETIPCTIRRAAGRGPAYVLDVMRNMATNSQAQKLGLWQLATSGTKQCGFKRAALAKDCANVVLAAMETFALDADLQAKGCLVLGWCFCKHKTVARHTAQTATRIIDAALANFPNHLSLVNYAAWAKDKFQTDLGPGPARVAGRVAATVNQADGGTQPHDAFLSTG